MAKLIRIIFWFCIVIWCGIVGREVISFHDLGFKIVFSLISTGPVIVALLWGELIFDISTFGTLKKFITKIHLKFIRTIRVNEPIVAYRIWRAIPGLGGIRLAPLFVQSSESPGQPFRAICHALGHCGERTKIQIDCTCGIYAFKSLKHLCHYMNEFDPKDDNVPRSFIVGEVYLGGKIFEHQKGYRAEIVYPKKFLNTNVLKSTPMFRSKIWWLIDATTRQTMAREYGCETE